MSVTGTIGSITAPGETNNGLGCVSTGISVSPLGNTRNPMFTHGTIAQDSDVGPGFVGNLSSVSAPTKRLCYVQATAFDVAPGASIENVHGVPWHNQTGAVLPKGHWCWGVE